MKLLLTIFFISICVTCAWSQEINKTIQTGNQWYKQQQFDKAEKEYDAAVKTEPANTTARFNLGNTNYRMGKQTEAMRTFDRVVADETNSEMKSKAWYNKGVVLSKQKRLEESIEAYKDALRQNPADQEARENLQKALLELKKKTPPKKDDKKKKQEKQQQKPEPKLNKKEAEQRLKLLEQKEKEVQQRLQKEKSRTGGSMTKDW